MPAKLKVIVLAIAALASNASVATADPPTYDCTIWLTTVPAVSPTHEGVAMGYVVHAADPNAAIRCYVTVDGVEVSSIPTATGATAGNVSFSASPTSTLQLCAEATTRHGIHRFCGTMDSAPIPPDTFWDLVYGVVYGVVNPLLCPVLARLAGRYGRDIVITPQGDVYVRGELQWDCPPYEW